MRRPAMRYHGLVIYLDNNATTQPSEAVIDAVARSMRDHWQNPSSIHREGQSARRLVEQSRASVARLIGARPRQLTFTSCATEALDWAMQGFLNVGRARDRQVLVASRLEHNAVTDLARHLESTHACEVRWVSGTTAGAIDIEAMHDVVDESVALVCAQWVNNETGVIQPIETIGEMARAAGAPFLCDGTQWVGKMPTSVEHAPFDALAFSSHKLHGPKGVGALWLRRGMSIPPQFHGSQESGRRAGTENVPGIAGFAAAAEEAMNWLADESNRDRAGALRDRLERGVLDHIPDAVVNGDPSARIWNTTNIGFPRLEAEALLIALSERGVSASAGAACSSGSLEPSPVLLAMNLPEEVAHGSVRFSLSRNTTEREIDEAIDIIAECVERLRASSEAIAR